MHSSYLLFPCPYMLVYLMTKLTIDILDICCFSLLLKKQPKQTKTVLWRSLSTQLLFSYQPLLMIRHDDRAHFIALHKVCHPCKWWPPSRFQQQLPFASWHFTHTHVIFTVRIKLYGSVFACTHIHKTNVTVNVLCYLELLICLF